MQHSKDQPPPSIGKLDSSGVKKRSTDLLIADLQRLQKEENDTLEGIKSTKKDLLEVDCVLRKFDEKRTMLKEKLRHLETKSDDFVKRRNKLLCELGCTQKTSPDSGNKEKQTNTVKSEESNEKSTFSSNLVELTDNQSRNENCEVTPKPNVAEVSPQKAEKSLQQNVSDNHVRGHTQSERLSDNLYVRDPRLAGRPINSVKLHITDPYYKERLKLMQRDESSVTNIEEDDNTNPKSMSMSSDNTLASNNDTEGRNFSKPEPFLSSGLPAKPSSILEAARRNLPQYVPAKRGPIHLKTNEAKRTHFINENRVFSSPLSVSSTCSSIPRTDEIYSANIVASPIPQATNSTEGNRGTNLESIYKFKMDKFLASHNNNVKMRSVCSLQIFDGHIYASCRDGTVKRFNMDDPYDSVTYSGHGDTVQSFYIDVGRNLIFTGSKDRILRCYDITTGHKIRDHFVFSRVAVITKGWDRIIIGLGNGYISQFDFRSDFVFRSTIRFRICEKIIGLHPMNQDDGVKKLLVIALGCKPTIMNALTGENLRMFGNDLIYSPAFMIMNTNFCCISSSSGMLPLVDKKSLLAVYDISKVSTAFSTVSNDSFQIDKLIRLLKSFDF